MTVKLVNVGFDFQNYKLGNKILLGVKQKKPIFLRQNKTKWGLRKTLT